ncbi:hypothetical protein IW261DRAFT_1427969 [Armillaria novae-zelandiae]|uniref:Uncharacterized protein n=1 Tax=Armillaria novae-zelandiae TaxID=153914 RepID=A0AA39NBU5_9AGAR|nr:hypothetical protein IW261DRAFT_1427969 [Armillaria novae-zelandiae]
MYEGLLEQSSARWPLARDGRVQTSHCKCNLSLITFTSGSQYGSSLQCRSEVYVMIYHPWIVYIYRNIFDHTYGGKRSALQQNNRRCQIDNLSTNTTAMSTEALQFENAYIWSLPVLCRQFLTTPLDPEKWIRMQAVTSDQDREILEFGKAMGRTLKFVADESWSKGDPPKDSIDFILPVRGTHKSANHLDTLVLVKAMDIAAGFLRLPTRILLP